MGHCKVTSPEVGPSGNARIRKVDSCLRFMLKIRSRSEMTKEKTPEHSGRAIVGGPR